VLDLPLQLIRKAKSAVPDPDAFGADTQYSEVKKASIEYADKNSEASKTEFLNP
jgi:hypothetical protein